ncbi:endodeoxyribonuclease RusA [Syntrophobotulus glycolicus DSM 8271]|uniref:Endodeoxyribonuclease RusA n=1 Tax=Syntrophobotulus glycolicus (strain DSM 8271 / FlGlyR) TaxID=645991 RepID=F0SXE8_SYNGF|nr:RusA family crossover junction endodeoxyribonuclease [Syntrophobotulus glycolicus]ADY54694.1 endodeoxyribonuclease RusA [Syntrophobotulus glycolicus DSM 8271]
MRTEFFIPMAKVPTATHQEKKVNWETRTFYEPDNVKAARIKIRAHLAKHVPEKKYTGPVRLLTKWCFLVTGKHKNGEYRTSRPDTDNLQKMLKDVMTTLDYWTDDALVASEIIEKFWADIPGIYIAIEEL